MQMSKNRKIWLKVIFALVGTIGGFLYWRMVGSTEGSWPITSGWYFPTLMGMILGYLLGDLTGGLIWKRAAENE